MGVSSNPSLIIRAQKFQLYTRDSRLHCPRCTANINDGNLRCATERSSANKRQPCQILNTECRAQRRMQIISLTHDAFFRVGGLQEIVLDHRQYI